MSWAAARARRRLGVTEGIGPGTSPLPAELDVRDALSERSDLLEGRRAEVDDAPGDAVGTTVVDYHSDRFAVVEIRHRDLSPEGEREIRSEQARVGAGVPGRLALLDPDDRADPPELELGDGGRDDVLGEEHSAGLLPVLVGDEVRADGAALLPRGQDLHGSVEHLARVLDEGCETHGLGDRLHELAND